MNAQQLKNAILQEAIEGRLVPQDPNDEPASALLARIRQEKEQLVKAGKLKKKDLVVNPISEDEIPFEIPESWEWVRLSTLSSAIHYGFTASAAPVGNAKLLRITDIQDDKVDWKSVPFCTTKEKDLNTYQLKNRDILIARTGGTIGKTYIVRQLDEVAVFASYLIRVIPLEEVNEEFLKLFMMTPCYWKQLTDASTGTGQPNVNGQSLSNLILPIPPKEEQIRILSKYEELLPKVEEYGKAQDALNKLNAELPERLKKSILQEAIEGRLVPQDPNDEPASTLLARIRQEKERLYKNGLLKKKEVTDRDIIEDEVPFPIPNGWVWTKIDNVAFVTKLAGFEYTEYIADNLVSKENGIPLFKGKNVQNGKIVYEFEAFIPIELSNELRRSQIKKKCLLTPYVGTIGNIGIHDKDGIYHLGSNVGKIEFYNEESINILEEYAKYYLMSSYGYDELTKYKKATAQESISIEAIRDVFIPLPPIGEQHRIVKKLEQVLDKIDKLKK